MLRLPVPFSMIVSGPSGSGKTEWVLEFLKHQNELLETPYSKIIFYYEAWQDTYERFPDIDFRHDVPAELEDQDAIVVLDDQLPSVAKSPELLNLFCVKSHHANLSTIFLTQSYYYDSKIIRCAVRNAHYLVFMQSPRTAGVLQHLGHQLFPEKPKLLLEAYVQAVKGKTFGYLFVDVHSRTPKELMVRTNIFPKEQPPLVFM